jgi:hypothetical protein
VKNRQIQPRVPRKHWANIKSVVDRQRFDAGPDPDSIRIQILHMLENQKFFILFSQHCQFTLFYLSHSHHRHRCHIFQYFRHFFGKSSLSLHLDEMDTDPDRQALNVDPGPDPSK